MKIKIPTNCPCCDYRLELVNDQLFCRNQACSAQLGKKLEHFCKTLGIKGLGAKTIEKLELADITELYYLEESEIAEALGSERIAEKLIQEIERSKQASLAQVLASFSIPLIGNTASQKICRVVNNIDEITKDTCKQAGLGDKATQNLLSWLETDFQEMKPFLPFSFQSNKATEAGNSTQKTVCITGKLTSFKTKQQAYDHLEAAGYKILESVTKSLDYLIDESDRSSSKRKKAEELNIKIIDNLLQFLKETTND
jgi:NAD-dependent DNA ligase